MVRARSSTTAYALTPSASRTPSRTASAIAAPPPAAAAFSASGLSSATRTSASPSVSCPVSGGTTGSAAQQPGRIAVWAASAHVSMSCACSVRPRMQRMSLMRPTMYSRDSHTKPRSPVQRNGSPFPHGGSSPPPPPPPPAPPPASSSSWLASCASVCRLYSYHSRFSWSQSLPLFDSTTSSTVLIAPRVTCRQPTAAPATGSATAPRIPVTSPVKKPPTPCVCAPTMGAAISPTVPPTTPLSADFRPDEAPAIKFFGLRIENMSKGRSGGSSSGAAPADELAAPSDEAAAASFVESTCVGAIVTS
mmetsp:Transcript_46826/g.151103  ORF Transcript_46826/g.151103 Transcript_46826/m.151103 type:complete len:306 (-) Transcript_46826:15-932(-)